MTLHYTEHPCVLWSLLLDRSSFINYFNVSHLSLLRLLRQVVKLLKFALHCEVYSLVLSQINIICCIILSLLVREACGLTFSFNTDKKTTKSIKGKLTLIFFREYFKMRRTCHGKTDWVNVKWKGGEMCHPLQQDTCSCGVIVIKVSLEFFLIITCQTFFVTYFKCMQYSKM